MAMISNQPNGNNPTLIAAQMILQNHSKLYNHLIDPIEQWLRDDPEQLSERAGAFSSGERLLISITLDVCFNYSSTRLFDVVYILDPNNFKNVISALSYLRKIR